MSSKSARIILLESVCDVDHAPSLAAWLLSNAEEFIENGSQKQSDGYLVITGDNHLSNSKNVRVTVPYSRERTAEREALIKKRLYKVAARFNELMVNYSVRYKINQLKLREHIGDLKLRKDGLPSASMLKCFETYIERAWPVFSPIMASYKVPGILDIYFMLFAATDNREFVMKVLYERIESMPFLWYLHSLPYLTRTKTDTHLYTEWLSTTLISDINYSKHYIAILKRISKQESTRTGPVRSSVYTEAHMQVNTVKFKSKLELNSYLAGITFPNYENLMTDEQIKIDERIRKHRTRPD